MSRWSFLAVFLALAAGLPAANLPVKRYALFIGANQGGKAQQPLQFAQLDARKMEEVMQEVGGVGPADQILLLDPTPDGIRGALGALAGRISGSGPRENRRTEFLFYYSGHSDETGLLLGDRSYSYKDLRAGLQSVPADVRIAILDSCSSGAFARLKGGVQRAPFLDQDSSQMTGHAFLTSSSDTEASQESDSLGGSFFTHFLVSGLRGGADKTGNGRITLNEAYEYAYQYTLARTESTRAGPQHPSYEIQLTGTGDLILADLEEATARLEVGAAVAGRVYVRDSAGQLFAEVVKGAGTPLDLVFPPGVYTVEVVSPTQALTAQVTLGAQGVSRLGPADFQAQALSRFATRGTEKTGGLDQGLEDQLCSALSTGTLGFIPGPPYEEKSWENKLFGFSLLEDHAANLDGFQVASLAAVTAGSLTGVQLTGLAAISHGPVSGVQAAGIVDIAEQGVKGVQLAGVFNNAGGDSSFGFQAAGMFNWTLGTFWGAQASVVNFARDLNGVQLGNVNLSGNLAGAQFGLVNITGPAKGVQVGLVNINSGFDGASFGLVNISPDAYYRPSVLYDSGGKAEAFFQWGMGWIYLVYGGAAVPSEVSDTRDFDQLAGVGTEFRSGNLFWDTDGGEIRRYQGGEPVGVLGYIRTSVGWDFGWVGIEAGVRGLLDLAGDTYSIGPYRFAVPVTSYVGLRFF